MSDEPVRPDYNFYGIQERENKRRGKILDKIYIDNIPSINKQIADLDCEEIRDLMLLFGCSVTDLARYIKYYKQKTKL
jgi:hypothetical protein